jgi:hypothetical protein
LSALDLAEQRARDRHLHLECHLTVGFALRIDAQRGHAAAAERPL